MSLGPLTSVQGQVNYYHVDFSNRLFNIAAYNFINPGASILVNVGGVTTNGFDVAATLNFGPHFHLYDGVSYNKSTYDTNYSTGANPVVVPIAGKQVPLPVDEDLRRGLHPFSLEASYRFDIAQAPWLKTPKVMVNVTNLNGERGVSTASTSSRERDAVVHVVPRLLQQLERPHAEWAGVMRDVGKDHSVEDRGGQMALQVFAAAHPLPVDEDLRRGLHPFSLLEGVHLLRIERPPARGDPTSSPIGGSTPCDDGRDSRRMSTPVTLGRAAPTSTNTP